VATAQKTGGRSKGGAKDWKQEVEFGVKPFKEFGSAYAEKGVLRKGAKVTEVNSKLHSGKYVCRKIRMSSMPCTNMTQINRHIRELSSLEHPNITKLIDAFEDKSFLYLVYERANPITLFEQIKQKGALTEEEAADYMRQVVMGLSVAHGQGIVHGKLSPRSIILADDEEDEESDTQIKVCDIGQAFVLVDTPNKMEDSEKVLELQKYSISPELADNELEQTKDATLPKYADRNDVWALGVIFYHMLSGTTPFRVTSRKDLVQQMVSKEIRFQPQMWSKLSEDARDLIENMMKLNPGIRISTAQILKHSWCRVAKATFPKKKMVELLENMKRNVEDCEFKRFVCRVIASQLPRDGKVQETVETAFRCLDANGDGVLSMKEVCKGLKKHLELPDVDHELEDLFDQLDRDGSGTLNVQEFVASALDQKRTTNLPVLWQAFNAFDNDQSGVVDFDEIEGTVREIEGVSLSKEQVDFMCGEIRKELEAVGTSGRIDFDQFVYLILNQQPNFSDAMRKDMYRMMWACGVDCWKVRHHKDVEKWDIKNAKKGKLYRRPQKTWSTDLKRKSSKSPSSSKERTGSKNRPAEAG
jgi:calcium-dependent protein kinase